MSQAMLEGALAWYSAGCSVIPVRTDGTKAPLIKWDPYKETRATEDQVRAWFDGEHHGLGVACGAVSGNLEMLEFEGRAVVEGLFTRFHEEVARAGLSDLLTGIMSGYSEESPSGGIHLFYRVSGSVNGNTKLAEREARDDELNDRERDVLERTGKRALRVLMETRGEGGQVVVAPSHGSTHETGKPWRVLTGTPATIATVTQQQRDALHIIGHSLDLKPAPAPVPDTFRRDPRMADGDLDPGEDFNNRADWREILEPAGWTIVRQQGERTFWRRPGKDWGLSAVTGGGGEDFLWVYTTSTELPTEQAMSKWRVYAKIWHREDYSSAAGELRRRGYGSPLPEQRVSDLGMFTPGSLSRETAPAVSGVSEQRYETPLVEGEPAGAGVEPEDLDPPWVFKRSELARLPAPEPLIEDTLDLGTVALVAGHYGSLKSFVVQDWAATLASLKPDWQGREALRHGVVIYVASEGANGLNSRFTSWETYNGLQTTDDLIVWRKPSNLTRYMDVAELYEFIIRKHGFVVIIDTLAKSMSGADENSTKDMGVVLESLYKLREATGDGIVIAVHHTARAGNIRGAVTLEDGVDTIYTAEGGADLMTFKRTKRKDGVTEDEMKFKLHVVDETDSAVLLNVDGQQIVPTSDFFGFRLSQGADRLLEILIGAFDHEGLEFTTSEMKQLATKDKNPLSPRYFYQARKELIAKAILIDVSPGRTKSTRFRLQKPREHDQDE